MMGRRLWREGLIVQIPVGPIIVLHYTIRHDRQAFYRCLIGFLYICGWVGC